MKKDSIKLTTQTKASKKFLIVMPSRVSATTVAKLSKFLPMVTTALFTAKDGHHGDYYFTVDTDHVSLSREKLKEEFPMLSITAA